LNLFPFLISVGACVTLLALGILAGILVSYRIPEMPVYSDPSVAQMTHYMSNQKKRRWGIFLTSLTFLLILAGFFAIEPLFPYEREVAMSIWGIVSGASIVLWGLAWIIRVNFYSKLDPAVLC